MLTIHTIEVTAFIQNCRILTVKGSQNAVVVDPGGGISKIEQYLKTNSLTLKEIWLTHAHIDHCGGVAALLRNCGNIPLLAHPGEKVLRENIEAIAKLYGVSDEPLENCPEPTRGISGGETLNFEGESFEVIFTPGHSPGHLCFYNAKENLLIAGDTLFAGSIGRTDLPGGDYSTLIASIKEKIFTLPPDTKVLSGHGPDTTVEVEKKSNPFFQ